MTTQKTEFFTYMVVADLKAYFDLVNLPIRTAEFDQQISIEETKPYQALNPLKVYIKVSDMKSRLLRHQLVNLICCVPTKVNDKEDERRMVTIPAQNNI